MDRRRAFSWKQTGRALRSARIATALIVLLPAGCWHHDHDDPAPSSPGVLAALKLRSMADCDTYKDYVADALVERYVRKEEYLPVMDGGGVTLPGGATTSSPEADTSSSQSSTPDHVTGTNVQESGVDEADIVKAAADGTLYVAHQKTLRVVRGHPPSQLQELGAIDVGAHIRDFYLDESAGRIVALAHSFSYEIQPAIANAWIDGDGARTVVAFIDVSDRTQPKLTARFNLGGGLIDSRRVDARIHLALRTILMLPAALRQSEEFRALLLEYYQATDEAKAGALATEIGASIRAAVSAADPSEFLPRVTAEIGTAVERAPLLSCADIQAPQVISKPQLLTIASVNTDGTDLAATAVTADGATVYASAQNLYVAHHSGGWWDAAGAEWAPQTAIHKFSIAGRAPLYRASGVVDGWIDDAFSLGEHAEHLRVATNLTTWNNSGTQSTNHLFVLGENDAGELVERGAVRDFGKDERIFSVRFLGSRGFVVTFRQIDPLFAFDLSDPANPQLVGELTIPGFSTYMHPLDDTHLLTIGRDGSTRQLQLQLFDVANLAQPALLHKYAPALPSDGYSYSEAEYDHHAFTYDETNRILALALAYSGGDSGQHFNGIATFSVDVTQGFGEIVRVDHGDLAQQAYCAGTVQPVVLCAGGNSVWYAYPRRSVIMSAGEMRTLYSISNAGVKATDLAAPHATLGQAVFPPDFAGEICCVEAVVGAR